MAVSQTGSSILHILIDVDDTLFPIGGGLPGGFHNNLSRLSELIGLANKGEFPTISLCTGREINYIIGATRSLTSPNTWSVLENGICLYNLATGERINHPLLTQDVEDIFREIRGCIPEIIRRFPVLEPYIGKEVNIALERHNQQTNLAHYVTPVREILSEFAEHIDITYSGHALDIMPKGINKGSGTMQLCEETGITPNQILSIGDSPNDFPVMEIVGYVGCPSNASEECKQLVERKGGHVSLYPYVIGVVDIIDHFVPMPK